MSLKTIDATIIEKIFQPVANQLEWKFGWEPPAVGKQLLIGLVAAEVVKGALRISHGESLVWVIIRWLVLCACVYWITFLANHDSEIKHSRAMGVFHFLRVFAVVAYLVLQVPIIVMMVLRVIEFDTVAIMGQLGQWMYVSGLYFLSCDPAPPRERDEEWVPFSIP